MPLRQSRNAPPTRGLCADVCDKGDLARCRTDTPYCDDEYAEERSEEVRVEISHLARTGERAVPLQNLHQRTESGDGKANGAIAEYRSRVLAGDRYHPGYRQEDIHDAMHDLIAQADRYGHLRRLDKADNSNTDRQ